MEYVSGLFEVTKSVAKVKINRSRTHLPLVKGLDLDCSFFNELQDSISTQSRQIYPEKVLIFPLIQVTVSSIIQLKLALSLKHEHASFLLHSLRLVEDRS